MSSSSSSPPIQRPLYGGAITCEIPGDWRDVSTVRQVPDHQECWQQPAGPDGGGGAVLVVEILSRQDDVTDSNAAEFFFQDLAEANGVGGASDGTSFSTIDDLPAEIQALETTLTKSNNNNSNNNNNSSSSNLESSFQTQVVVIKGGIGFQTVTKGKDTDAAGNSRLQNVVPTKVQIQVCVLRLPVQETELLVTLTQPQLQPSTTHCYTEDFTAIVASLRIHDWGLFGG